MNITDKLAEALRWAMSDTNVPTTHSRVICPQHAVSWHEAVTALAEYDAAKAQPGLSADGGAYWKEKYQYALTLIDAAAADGDGMAGVAFSAQVPVQLLDGKSASEIADLLCNDAIAAAPAEQAND